MRLAILAAILCACAPTLSVKEEIQYGYQYGPDYTVLNIVAPNTMYNSTLEIDGVSLRINADECRVVNTKVICTLGTFKSFSLPFRGIINTVRLTGILRDKSVSFNW